MSGGHHGPLPAARESDGDLGEHRSSGGIFSIWGADAEGAKGAHGPHSPHFVWANSGVPWARLGAVSAGPPGDPAGAGSVAPLQRDGLRLLCNMSRREGGKVLH